jgi:hypothetical protein
LLAWDKCKKYFNTKTFLNKKEARKPLNSNNLTARSHFLLEDKDITFFDISNLFCKEIKIIFTFVQINSKMKTLKLITLILILSSCAQGKTVYVWNMKDIIGLWIGGGIVLIVTIVGIIDYIRTGRKDPRK